MWRWVKRLRSQISSLDSVAVRGGPEDPSRPLGRGGDYDCKRRDLGITSVGNSTYVYIDHRQCR